jgi:hypothetical protein
MAVSALAPATRRSATDVTERDQEEQDSRIMMNMEAIIEKRLNEVKLAVEAHKLEAEHDKLRRDRHLAPWIIAASLSSGVVAAVVVSVISHLWK